MSLGVSGQGESRQEASPLCSLCGKSSEKLENSNKAIKRSSQVSKVIREKTREANWQSENCSKHMLLCTVSQVRLCLLQMLAFRRPKRQSYWQI